VTISNEIVGNSDGTSDQRFVLLNTPVISNSISVTVNDTVYNSVPYIIDAAGIDPVFYSSTDAEETTSIVFGDGVSGRIPPANSQIIVTYRVGGGVQGNVNANTLTNILTNFSPGLSVNNTTRASGGADLESTDSIRVNAPSSIRAVNRAVSLRDYGDLAVQVPGVAKAIATSEVYTNVNLYIAPYGDPGADGEGDLTPVFNQLSNRIGQFFIDKTPPNVSLTLLPPTFVDVNITANIQALPQYRQSVVKRNAETALAEILSFDNVNFADRISLHYVIEALAGASGVSYSNVTLLARADASQSGTNDAVFLVNEIPKEGTVTITVSGGIVD
jgi:predicted phage baseplate assembly protein